MIDWEVLYDYKADVNNRILIIKMNDTVIFQYLVLCLARHSTNAVTVYRHFGPRTVRT